ncbi:hypothetical protein PQX77_005033 [Marasmius sp. AFHP31]|nr:hypothetical protein PQX77_005033 [Marasmius sp. AFHP31]
MPVSTVSAAIHITPVVIRTFFGHGKRKAVKYQNSEEEEATDDIFFDEAFHIVKAFIDLGTRNTVESLQAFTNTHVPAPYWAAVSPVLIPLSTCNDAADILIEWFGPEDLKRVVGGERWWQVRGLDGVDAEWITEKEYLSESIPDVDMGRKLSTNEETILRMEELDTVMFYVHGGGYFWGSINTHRYQLIRYGRFRSNVHQLLLKRPTSPQKQGKGVRGELQVTKSLSQLKRLLTYHSGRRRSILGHARFKTWLLHVRSKFHGAASAQHSSDLYLIRPPKNALHKPVPPEKIVFAGDSAGGGLCLSVLAILRDMGVPMPAGAVLISPWVDLTHSFPSVMANSKTDIIPEHGFLAKPSTLWPIHPIAPQEGRIGPTKSTPPPDPGHADTLKPSGARVQDDKEDGKTDSRGVVETQEEMQQETSEGRNSKEGDVKDDSGDSSDDDLDRWEPKPPKVLMKDPEAVPLELRSQIQLYATNEQLTHPLVSPILQSTLGGLPPLYIIAGDGEVLRDEIIYLAHRAAYPQDYPTRRGVLRSRRQRENVEKFTTPTKVHFQVYDGMCHVLPVFMFTPSAKHAYRAIATFMNHVTNHPNELPDRSPFLDLFRPPSEITLEDYERKPKSKRAKSTGSLKEKGNGGISEVANGTHPPFPKEGAKPVSTQALFSPPASESNPAKEIEEALEVIMVRERVNIHGRVRRMEPRDEMQALQVKPAEVGLIKEAPAVRWHQGQEQWDKMFKKRAKKILKKRAHYETKSEKMIGLAREQGFSLVREPEPEVLILTKPPSRPDSKARKDRDGSIQANRRWGPLDLDDEDPPPSAIANRRDTHEGFALLRKHIYYAAPVTHRKIPKLKASEAVKAAFDPHDDPIGPPKQSVSEQQVKNNILPMHGLKMWDAILRYFMRETSRKAADTVANNLNELSIPNGAPNTGSQKNLEAKD